MQLVQEELRRYWPYTERRATNRHQGNPRCRSQGEDYLANRDEALGDCPAEEPLLISEVATGIERPLAMNP